MTTLREAAMMALEALEYENSWHLPRNEKPYVSTLEAITALRAALAQQEEPVQSLPIRATVFDDAHPNGIPLEQWVRSGKPPQRKPETIDEAMQQPRAMAQAYENGYKAGVAHEREACAKLAESTVCDTHLPTGVRIYGTRAADAIRARGNK